MKDGKASCILSRGHLTPSHCSETSCGGVIESGVNSGEPRLSDAVPLLGQGVSPPIQRMVHGERGVFVSELVHRLFIRAGLLRSELVLQLLAQTGTVPSRTQSSCQRSVF